MQKPRIESLVLFLCFLLTDIFSTAKTQDVSIYDTIYEELYPIPCVRLLNAAGMIGCQTRRKKTGILYWIDTQESFSEFISSNPSGTYAVIMPYPLVTNDNLNELESSGKLGGVIAIVSGNVADVNLSPDKLSLDSVCPNCEFGLYRNDPQRYQWNPIGNGLIYNSYDFPIFALDPHDLATNNTFNEIMASAQNNSLAGYVNFPLKAVEFSSFMYAAIDASTCLRREWCLPVGGLSVYATPSFNMSHEDGKPIVVVSTSLDSRGLFQDIVLGVDNGVSGTVALLAVADALSNSPVPLTEFPKHIMFTAFTAESWGFAGSQRFVHDISTPFDCQNSSKAAKVCPYTNAGCTAPCVRDLDFTRINFGNVDSIFEISQVATLDQSYYAHVDNASDSVTLAIVERLSAISAAAKGTSFIKPAYADGPNKGLPPSSSMAFLEKNRKIPAIVLGDYKDNLNSFYNSEYDVKYTADSIASICALANVTAQAVWLQAQNKLANESTAPVTANCMLVTKLMECLTTNYSCPLTNQFFNASDLGRVSHYSSVFQYGTPNLLPLFAYNFLANATAATRRGACDTITDCGDAELCIQHQCVKTFTRYHDAYGMGLEMDGHGKFFVADPDKPTWVESVRDPVGLRLFNISSTISQIMELITGIIITIASIVAVIYSKRYLKKTLKVT